MTLRSREDARAVSDGLLGVVFESSSNLRCFLDEVKQRNSSGDEESVLFVDLLVDDKAIQWSR